jgi:ketosteroid isomerase-like protein
MHIFVLLMTALLIPTAVNAQSTTADASAVSAVVDAFHAALYSGNAAAAMELIAEDALMLEAGGVETRAQYQKDHLPADIEFSKSVTAKGSPVRTVVAGNAAWVITSTDYTGSFQNRPVDSIGVELMVLSRENAGWRIRAIHWSGRARQR